MATSQTILDPAKTGKRGRKLSPAAQALLVKRIIAGDDNQRIVARLKAARLLDADDTLTQWAFVYYRRLPACRVQRECLAEVAQQAAHQELSQSVVNLVAQARLARQQIIGNAGSMTVQEITDLARVQFRSLRLIYHVAALDSEVALCDGDEPPVAAGTVGDALRRWRRAERNGCTVMAQIGL